jgi:hypothetical protein
MAVHPYSHLNLRGSRLSLCAAGPRRRTNNVMVKSHTQQPPSPSTRITPAGAPVTIEVSQRGDPFEIDTNILLCQRKVWVE